MDRDRLVQLVVLLGAEFSRRGMIEHCDRLRLYYLAVQHGLDRRGQVQLHWDEELVVEWMRMLRIPPYEDAYPVRATTTCHGCEPRAPGSVITKGVFPGGAKMECRQCGAVWLVMR